MRVDEMFSHCKQMLFILYAKNTAVLSNIVALFLVRQETEVNPLATLQLCVLLDKRLKLTLQLLAQIRNLKNFLEEEKEHSKELECRLTALTNPPEVAEVCAGVKGLNTTAVTGDWLDTTTNYLVTGLMTTVIAW